MDIRKPIPSGKTTILAMLLSVFAAIMVFVPWIHAPGLFHSRNGLFSWHGVVNLIFLITLFLFLVATSPLRPVPLWRTFPLIGVAFLVLLFTGLFIAEYGRFMNVEAGVYLEFISGFLLLFLGALEIRGHLLRWQQDRGAMPMALPVDEMAPRSDDSAFRDRIRAEDS